MTTNRVSQEYIDRLFAESKPVSEPLETEINEIAQSIMDGALEPLIERVKRIFVRRCDGCKHWQVPNLGTTIQVAPTDTASRGPRPIYAACTVLGRGWATAPDYSCERFEGRP